MQTSSNPKDFLEAVLMRGSNALTIEGPVRKSKNGKVEYITIKFKDIKGNLCPLVFKFTGVKTNSNKFINDYNNEDTSDTRMFQTSLTKSGYYGLAKCILHIIFEEFCNNNRESLSITKKDSIRGNKVQFATKDNKTKVDGICEFNDFWKNLIKMSLEDFDEYEQHITSYYAEEANTDPLIRVDIKFNKDTREIGIPIFDMTSQCPPRFVKGVRGKVPFNDLKTSEGEDLHAENLEQGIPYESVCMGLDNCSSICKSMNGVSIPSKMQVLYVRPGLGAKGFDADTFDFSDMKECGVDVTDIPTSNNPNLNEVNNSKDKDNSDLNEVNNSKDEDVDHDDIDAAIDAI